MQMCVCGAANTDEARFCAKCGVKLEPPLPRCKTCNAELLPGAGFCTGCGAAVDDKAIEAAKAEAVKPPEQSPHFFDAFKYIFQPVTSEAQAKAMAQIGSGSALLVAIYMGLTGLALFPAGGLVVAVQYAQVAIHAVCVWAISKGYTVGAVVSLALHLINLGAAFTLLQSANAPKNFGESFLLFAVVIVAPVGLVTGIRGCMAWSRFRREGAK